MDRRERAVRLFKGYLHGCLATVQKAMDEGDFASLRDVHFWKGENDTEGHLPDYGNPTTVAYYQLRFACGYAFEYYTIYRLTLEWLKRLGQEEFSVVSLGCGSGLDRYSLELAINDVDYGTNCYLDYKDDKHGWMGDARRWFGVDIAKWGKPDGVVTEGFPAHDNVVKVFDGGVVEYFQRCSPRLAPYAYCDKNVFLFPRILSELDEPVVDDLVRAIREASYCHDRIVVCVANRAASFSMGETSEQTNSRRVISAFKEAGFLQAKQLPEELMESLKYWDAAQWECDAGFGVNSHEAPYYRIVSKEDPNVGVRIDNLGFGKEFCLPNTIRDFMSEHEDAGKLSEPHRRCPDSRANCVESCSDADYRGGKLVCPLAANPVCRTGQMNFQIVMLERGSR